MFNYLADILREAGMVGEAWVAGARRRGELVRLFREYYAGEHRLKLTAEMRRMMQIADDRLDRYNANYCEMVVDTMADRLAVERVVVTGADEAQTWADDVMSRVRMDGVQMAVHEAALRDGEAYVMVDYGEDGIVRDFVLETAYDGEYGIVPVWDASGRVMVAAVKIWCDASGMTRGNIYYPNSISKYGEDGDGVRLIETVDTVRDGRELGVPLVRFATKAGRAVSALVNVVPLQDSLNRTLVSMVMSSELEAFSILFAVGFTPPASLTPGMILQAAIEDENGKPVRPDTEEDARAYAAMQNSYRLERIGGGDLSTLISQAEFIIQQVSNVSSTPIPSLMGGDSQSGEALKQREARLLGRIRRAHVVLGNAWEDVLALAHRVETLYAVSAPPEAEGWACRWSPAEVRSDADLLAAADTLHRWGYEREALRLLGQSSLVAYRDEDIERLMQEKAADSEAALLNSMGSLDGFGAFNPTP
jgi:hypothetical protein